MPCNSRNLVSPSSRWLGLLTIAVSSATLLTSCATIPAAAPQLSAELTGRIQETRLAHLQVVRMYTDERRKEVDRFIEDEWVPTFAKQLFQQPAISAAWDDVVRSNDPVRRLEFITALGPRLQTQINAKRIELMQPLDEVERLITRHLDDHYNQMLAMNATLTGLLEAGAEATAIQQNISRRLDSENRLPDFLNTADRVVQRLLDTSTSVQDRKAQIDSLLGTLRQRPERTSPR
jgi:hypothetical protein